MTAKSRRKTKKQSGRYMKVVVGLIILQVIAYTWVHLYLSYALGVEIAPSATLGFYGFCGVEAGVCGWLKRSEKAKEDEQ